MTGQPPTTGRICPESDAARGRAHFKFESRVSAPGRRWTLTPGMPAGFRMMIIELSTRVKL